MSSNSIWFLLLVVTNLGTAAALVKALMDRDHIIEAVREVYYAAWWYPDRPVPTTMLWTEVRDACGFKPGGTAILGPPTRGPLYPAQKPYYCRCTANDGSASCPVHRAGE